MSHDDDQYINEELSVLTPLFKDIGVSKIYVNLAGGGDSGDVEDVEFYGDEDEPLNYNDVKDSIEESGLVSSIYFLNDNFCSIANSLGDWYNNAGGTVRLEFKVTDRGIINSYGGIEYNDDYDDEWDYENEEDEGMGI